jgi:hypothetical protein
MPCILILVLILQLFLMSSKMFTLYDPFKINLDLVKEQQFAQEIIYYGES